MLDVIMFYLIIIFIIMHVYLLFLSLPNPFQDGLICCFFPASFDRVLGLVRCHHLVLFFIQLRPFYPRYVVERSNQTSSSWNSNNVHISIDADVLPSAFEAILHPFPSVDSWLHQQLPGVHGE